jgi:hypothetical protein
MVKFLKLPGNKGKDILAVVNAIIVFAFPPNGHNGRKTRRKRGINAPLPQGIQKTGNQSQGDFSSTYSRESSLL